MIHMRHALTGSFVIIALAVGLSPTPAAQSNATSKPSRGGWSLTGHGFGKRPQA